MDYQGQTSQQGTNQPFFTEGVGNPSPEFTDTPEENLNLSDTTPWGNVAATPTRGQSQSLGNNAINGQLVERPDDANFEAYAPTPETGPDFGPPIPELAQVENVEPVQTTPETELKELGIDQSIFELKGERPLSGAAIKFMEDNEREMSKTKDVATFADKVNLAREDFKGKNYGSS